MVRFVGTGIVAALSLIGAVLVPASSVGAESGELPLGDSTVESDADTNAGTTGPGEGGVEEGSESSNTTAGTGSTPDEGSAAVGQLLADGHGLVASKYDGSRVTVSTDVALTWSDFEEKELAAARLLVGDESASGKRASSSEEGVDYLTLYSSDGFAVLIELDAADSENEHVFNIGLPDGASLILTEEGSVDVLGSDRYTIGSFEAPWALDSNGQEVPTRFEVKGNTITQIIDTDDSTAYPVIADPKYTWGWITGTVYFNKSETKKLCSATKSIIYTLIKKRFWVPIILAVATTLFAVTCLAKHLGKCIKVKSSGLVQYYTGGYCT